MYLHYQDYVWQSGKPKGTVPAIPAETPVSYKIVIDPYFKRISIEKYHYAVFNQVVYDSIFLDFRRLTEKDQNAWQREKKSETTQELISFLRNEEDRIVLIETIVFEGERCKSCSLSSIHGVPIAVHRMFYEKWGDPFNGVVLYDRENKRVLKKSYAVDPLTGDFTDLLIEEK